MPRTYPFGRVGETTGNGQTGTVISVPLKARKAKCPENQQAVERLEELANNAANQQSNFVFSIRRAIKSLAECKEPITTQKEAMGLKFVGPALAKTIVPGHGSLNVASTKSNSKDGHKVNSSNADSSNVSSRRGRKLNGELLGTETNSGNTVESVAQCSTSSSSFSSATASASSSSSSTNPSKSNAKKRSAPASDVLIGRTTKIAPPPMKMAKTDPVSSNTVMQSVIDPTPKQKAYNLAKQAAEMLVLPKGGLWKVLLLVDGREHRSKQVVSSCKQAGIPTEERHLPIGDMAWIAQCIGGDYSRKEGSQ